MNEYRYRCSVCHRLLLVDRPLMRWRCGDGCGGVFCREVLTRGSSEGGDA